MIPMKLRLRNFMCYREPMPLDLTDIHLACLAGDNGHGKSALLDAMTWALWGRARARNDDELVAIGEKDMEVEFEFRLGDAHYRVIRKRSLGRQSKGALEFQVEDSGSFRSFTANTQHETQSRINGVLRMDYETFINSALLLQGRADEFTVKPPAERKRILADILGLAIYDEYEEQAKSLSKEKELAGREVQARVQEIDRELEHRSEYESELAAAQENLAELSRTARAAEEKLRESRDQVKALEAQRAQLADVRKRILTAQGHLRDLDQQIDGQQARLVSYESILGRRVEIESGHAHLLQARQQEAECSAKLSQLLPLTQEKAELEKASAEAKQKMELEERLTAARVADLERLAGQRAQWDMEHSKVAQELQELAALQAKAREHRQRVQELTGETAHLNAVNTQLKAEMNSLREKINLLGESTAACPLCGQGLSEDDRLHLLAQFEQNGTEQGQLHRQNSARLKEIGAQVQSLESEVELLERELRRLPALQGREATLSKSLQEAQEAASRWGEQQQVLLSLRRQLEEGQYATTEREQLATVEASILRLGYDKLAHDQAREALVRLASFESEKAELERAQQAIAELRASQQRLSNDRQNWAAALQTDEQRQAELQAGLASVEELSLKLQANEREVDELRRKEGHARQVLGAAQQKLDYCGYLARERQERTKQLDELAEERGLYEELRTAFGKKGLQALIIESVIPELEDEANALLRRMTEGRMSLHFETQRDTKSGSVMETLEIKISDESGPRSYEMYSGGEAFRINFAIRIALSKLLARRVGAQLQTLIIDEGFGTQDADGRQRLVEAINSIKDDFVRIIVITHIEELKDAFPVRIDVYKTPQGSQIALS